MTEDLKNAVINGYIDKTINANEYYVPKLLVNDFSRNEKVLTTLINELKKCESFIFCVAFLTQSGVQVLLQTLHELEEKKINGTIIVSEYQYFSQPKALEKMLEFSNIELRIVANKYNMHTKGYLFFNNNQITSIIGSSNLTQNALLVNKELNLKITSTTNSSHYSNIINEFEEIKKDSILVNQEYLAKYNELYKSNFKQITNNTVITNETITPNKMQIEALKKLKETREFGHKKALIISSTGTGKTYLSAFDVKEFKAKKFLFIIHREQIAKEALKTFKKVIGEDVTYGILSGGSKCESDFIFSTIQTLSKDNVLNTFDKDHFDYIVYDEVHRIDADSYKKVYNYFEPKFLLGMTATPERTDNGDIYSYFDHNVVYEIRLQDAMEVDLITPFHYYGVSEFTVNGKTLDDHSSFNNLISEDRVKHIIEKIKFYGYCGDKVRGLIFVSKNEEAKELSRQFNMLGYNTVALSGKNSQEEREYHINQLENNLIDYIFTVDIFNEGIDIPSINQIIMLRPTASAIIFIQQLGRGLRKFYQKDYVVVIDFIGNYENNFMIPIAISGDKTYNKDNIRRFVQEGNNILPGVSTINFEKIVKERIFSSIDNAKFKDIKFLKEAYFNLKNRLGRIPTLTDFSEYGSIDILKIINRFDSYHNFLVKYESNYKVELNEIENNIIDFVSSKFLSGKRPHELEFLLFLIQFKTNVLEKFKTYFISKYPNLSFTKNTEINIINQLTQTYLTGTGKAKFMKSILIENKNGIINISNQFANCLNNQVFKMMLEEIISYALNRNDLLYRDCYKKTSFKLYEKYNYEDVFRLLDWEISEVALNVGGYKHDLNTNTFPVFINYHKEDEISDTIKYEDGFINSSSLKWTSKSGRTLESKDIKILREFEKNNVKIPLFVRKNKNDEESKEFYFLGEITPQDYFNEFTMKNTVKSAVEVKFDLDEPVREDIYNYITEDI